MKSLLKVKAAPRVKLKQENGHQAPAAKRVKAETLDPAVKLEPAEEVEEEEDGLAGLLGQYYVGFPMERQSERNCLTDTAERKQATSEGGTAMASLL